MKKKIYLLLTLFISLFVFTGRVEAESPIMWIKCENSKSNGKDWIFYKTTDSNNISNRTNTWKFHELGSDTIYSVSNDCWFKNETDIGTRKCKKAPNYGEDNVDELLSQGKCPAELYKMSDTVTLYSQKNPIETSNLDNNQYLVYQLNNLVSSTITSNLNYNPYRTPVVVVEYYNSNGDYIVFTSGDFFSTIDHVDAYTWPLFLINNEFDTQKFFSNTHIQEMSEKNNGANYFKIGEDFSKSYLANFVWPKSISADIFGLKGYSEISFSCLNCTTEEECKNLKNSETCCNAIENNNSSDYNPIGGSGNNASCLFTPSDFGAYNDFEILFDSSSHKQNLVDAFSKWYENNINKLEDSSSENKSIASQQLYNTCSAFIKESKSNKKYSFSDSYTAKNMLDDLRQTANNLNNTYVESNNYFTCGSDKKAVNMEYAALDCILRDVFTVDERITYGANGDVIKTEDNYSYYDYFLTNSFRDEDYINGFAAVVWNDLEKMLEEKGYGDLNTSLDERTTELGKCASYLDKNSSLYGLSDEETSLVRKLYEDLANIHGLDIVIDCEGLLGQDLIKKINSYTNIIKIIIPILLLGFGVFDFTKALFTNSEDGMKKAQQDFIKRLGIAILIFFVPTIIELILNIANSVWTFISPDTCGLF